MYFNHAMLVHKGDAPVRLSNGKCRG